MLQKVWTSTDSSTGSIIANGGAGIGGDINAGSTVIGTNLTTNTDR